MRHGAGAGAGVGLLRHVLGETTRAGSTCGTACCARGCGSSTQAKFRRGALLAALADPQPDATVRVRFARGASVSWRQLRRPVKSTRRARMVYDARFVRCDSAAAARELAPSVCSVASTSVPAAWPFTRIWALASTAPRQPAARVARESTRVARFVSLSEWRNSFVALTAAAERGDGGAARASVLVGPGRRPSCFSSTRLLFDVAQLRGGNCEAWAAIYHVVDPAAPHLP